MAYRNLGDFNKSIEFCEKSLEINKNIEDREVESVDYKELGAAYYSLGNFNKAIGYYEKALEIDKAINKRAGEATCCTNLGENYRSLGNFNKAIEYHKKALEIDKAINKRAGEAICYVNLGAVYDGLGNFKKAVEFYEKSLRITKDIGDRAGESKCYRNLGNTYNSLENFNKAIEFYKKSLRITKDIGIRAGESECYTGLGGVYRNLGYFNKAVEYREKSLRIAKDIGDRVSESKCYQGLGNDYYSLGDFNKAIEFYEKSLGIFKDIGDRAGESGCYTNLAVVYDEFGDFNKAIEFYEKSLGIFKDIGDRAGESKCFGNLGHTYQRLGEFNKAIEYHEKSLGIYKDLGDRGGESAYYTNLGAIYGNLGDLKKSIKFFKKSLEIKKDIGDIDSKRNINLSLGRAYSNLDKPELAYNYYQRSIELSEIIVGRLVEEEYKIPFFSRISDAYQYMIPLCLKLKKGDKAFEYTERSKSRAFLDLIAATEIKPLVEVTSELKWLLYDEESYLTRLREIQTRHIRQTKVTVEPGESEKIFEKLNKIYGKIEKYDPEYVFTRRGEPLSLSKIQDMLSSQPRDMVLIEYFMTENETFIFVISSKDKELHIETVPLSAEKLNRYLKNYWREVVNHPGFKDIGDTWLDLSKYLIEPISEFLTEGDLIYFVPYGLLHYLPMHALELNGEPLIKMHPIVYAPSASLIKFCQNKGSGELKSGVSFGVAFGKNEETEFEEKVKNMNEEEKEEIEEKIKKVKALFEGESKNVAGLFSTKPYNAESATKDKVIETCTDKDVIHFSCHGYFDLVDPLSSGVKLYDNVLTAREIFDMRLDTELVTLSACQTGLNEISPGDELFGLTRAFLYVGAPSVIVSLWSVDARSTQELMLEFYKLLKNGSDKATALQEAQKRIMENEKYSHPYYWAPFILVGDWE
jgi:tetratricopeptide (TPR) repeat protein